MSTSLTASQIRPEDVPVIVRGLLSVGDAIGVAKSHGALRGDTVERLVAAGELAFEHLADVLPGDLMAIIAAYVEECIAEHETRCGRSRKARHALETIGGRFTASDTGIQHGPLWRECGEPTDDGSGKVCRRICAPGRDYHGGGHWFADPDLDGAHVRHSTARWIVTGEQPGEARST